MADVTYRYLVRCVLWLYEECFCIFFSSPQHLETSEKYILFIYDDSSAPRFVASLLWVYMEHWSTGKRLGRATLVPHCLRLYEWFSQSTDP